MNIKSLINKYKKLGLRKSQIVYITSDFGKIMNNLKLKKQELLDIHFYAIKSIIGKKWNNSCPNSYPKSLWNK